MHAEDGRQWVHVGAGLFALLLRVFTPWQASGLAAVALAFNLFGGLGGVALALWARPAVERMPPVSFTVAATLAAAIVAAFVETIPVRLDDNISVPASAAAVLWLASLMDASSFASTRSA